MIRKVIIAITVLILVNIPAANALEPAGADTAAAVIGAGRITVAQSAPSYGSGRFCRLLRGKSIWER